MVGVTGAVRTRHSRVIVVGGGAAGMMAAGTAAELGHEVRLLERNEKTGKKLYITGKGRCNFTNAANDAFFDNVPRNPRFLYSAYRAMDCADTVQFFEQRGVKSVVERGGRVFPASGKSSDVLRALTRFVTDSGARIDLHTRALGIEVENGAVRGVRTEQGRLAADAVVLATGGLSYPSTGSTGDGLSWAAELGHRVEPARASLIGMETRETWVRELAGLSLRNVRLTAVQQGKAFYTELGEMLFTHHGVSGPLVLTASSHAKSEQGIELRIDLKPGLTMEQLDARVLRDFNSAPGRQFKNALGALLPSSLIPVIVALSGIEPEWPAGQVSKAGRQGLCALLKELTLHVTRFRPIDEAIVTRGGVNVKDINPSTMESKLVRGLYFAGEMIDVDALTGGFNLQIAFSTGRLAGQSV